MSVRRLYLIRRESREFIGPMNVDDFKLRLSRLEFGMQDEISGHCGPWVVLDHSDPLHHYYPEVAAILSENLPLSWREVTGHAQVISRHETKKKKSVKTGSREGGNARAQRRRNYEQTREPVPQNRSGVKVMMMTLVLVVAAAAVIAFGVRRDDGVSTMEAAQLAGQSDLTEFMNYMGVKIVPMAGKLMKNQKAAPQWLPYLRMYAFNSTGVIDGVGAKVLRGELPASAPVDCSVVTLKRRWRENAAQIVGFVQGKSMAKNPWTKILALDPHWVRRRPSKGWMIPRNYYEGCIQMALTAVHSLSSEVGLGADPQDQLTPEMLNLISRRLQTLMDIVATGKSQVPLDNQSFIGGISCLDATQNIGDFDQCKFVGDAALKPVYEERQAFALLHMLQNSTQPADQKSLQTLRELAGKIQPEDLINRNDLIPEGKLAGYLLNGVSTEQAIINIEAEFQDIKARR